MSEKLQDALVYLIPIIALLIRTWLADREARRANTAEALAKAAKAQAELEAEMERLATKAVVLGVQKLKANMSEEKKRETNTTIKAFTESAGVEDRVHKIVEEVKKSA